MGKRLIIKGADFSNVAASVEPILNPLNVLAVGQGGNWIDSYFQNAPVGSYFYLTNVVSAGNTNLKTKNALSRLVNAEMPEGYNSLNYCGAILAQQEGETKYDVAYPDDYEAIDNWDVGYMYAYASSQSTEPQKSANGGFSCTKVQLNQGDVLIANVLGGDGARAIWAMKPDYSSTIKVADSSSRGDCAPICYEATEDCVVFINDSRTIPIDSYILRK